MSNNDKTAVKGAEKVKEEPFITEKMKADGIFMVGSFLVVVWLLFHYAMIMRKLLRNPYMETSEIAIHGGLFVIDLVVSVYLVLAVFYPYVYADEIKKEQEETEALKKNQ
ncbi:hypothetical protein CAAN1_04S03158 [[Candida] anglica]|uniref:Uncharacterized protein n=1 Tax=[Candida] anglica TaxID=148631 RepID=A0ABP0E9E0_9ASCO